MIRPENGRYLLLDLLRSLDGLLTRFLDLFSIGSRHLRSPIAELLTELLRNLPELLALFLRQFQVLVDRLRVEKPDQATAESCRSATGPSRPRVAPRARTAASGAAQAATVGGVAALARQGRSRLFASYLAVALANRAVRRLDRGDSAAENQENDAGQRTA